MTEIAGRAARKTETAHDSFTIERSYRADPQRVFQAFADPQTKRLWFAEGPGFIVGSYDLDFRVGGKETGSFSVDSPGFSSDEIRNDTYYFDIVENERIVYGYSMANEGTPFSASLSTVTLQRSQNGGTKLTFHEQVAFFEHADGVKMRETGTRQLLERLAEVLGEPSKSIDWEAASEAG